VNGLNAPAPSSFRSRGNEQQVGVSQDAWMDGRCRVAVAGMMAPAWAQSQNMIRSVTASQQANGEVVRVELSQPLAGAALGLRHPGAAARGGGPASGRQRPGGGQRGNQPRQCAVGQCGQHG
jgi:hypothetical protein